MKISCLLLLTGLTITTNNWEASGAELAQPVSGSARANLAGAGGSFLPVMTPDARYVAFLSQAKNLVPNHNPSPYLDLFVRDRLSGTTTLISVNALGRGGGDGSANYPAISANGQLVVFAGEAENLVANDTNGTSDVFVRDLASGITRLVSINAADTTSGSYGRDGSVKPVLTPDGRWVVFESDAIDLVADDTNGIGDLFLRDLQNNTTVLVSVGAQSWWPPASGRSYGAAITPDGSRVAFVSTAANLVPGLTNRFGEIYVRDVPAGLTFWASTNVAGCFAGDTNGYGCLNPVISADGTHVAFKAFNPSLTNSVLVVYHDLASSQTTLLTSNGWPSTWPALSADGRFLAYEAGTNLYVWDAQSGSNTLVSVNADGTGPANGISRGPVLTPDGQIVAFLSTATDLVTNGSVSPGGGFQLYVRAWGSGTTRLASHDLTGQASRRDLEGIVPTLSADGRQVAFDSPDDTLVPDDLNQASDVFVRDLEVGRTELVSGRLATLPARTGVAGTAGPLSISADGGRVAFISFDNNLVAGDTNRQRDVLVGDLASGAILPVSLDTNGVFNPMNSARQPVISGNGQCVLFYQQTNAIYWQAWESPARLFWRDLANGITEEVEAGASFSPEEYDYWPTLIPAISADGRLVAYHNSQIYLRDMLTGTNQLISARRGIGTYGGNDRSFDPMLSPDGRWVVFRSRATDLLATNILFVGLRYRLYARDLASNTTTLISWEQNSPDCTGVGFSASGRYFAYSGKDYTCCSSAVERIYLYDFQTQTNVVVSDNGLNPRCSDDGRWVAFERRRSYKTCDIILKDMQTGAETLVSTNRTGTGAGNGSSTAPLISADGRFIVFVSTASDLVANDNNNVADVFVRDRALGVTLLVSRNRQGTGAGKGVSSHPVMAADGRTVFFQSYADDLAEGDYNRTADIFVLRLGAGDSDGDGLDDGWEVAFFGNLSRDGSGDFDNDGQTDRQEYLAGTDPTNGGSILRVLTLSSLSDGRTTILWNAVPGKTYQVQYKNSLMEAQWSTLPGLVTVGSATAALTDHSAGPQKQRFYRVVLVP